MTQAIQRQKVWDVPTRLFHWLLVGLFGFSWWSAETHHMDWHRYSGGTICGLIIFRIFWGVVGTDTARFSHFLKGPRAIWTYIRPGGKAVGIEALGHNPLGGWSVMALLVVTGVQVVSGLFAVDIDGIESGPLSYLVDFDHGRIAATVHRASFSMLLVLVNLHVAAILFYLLVKRRNLIWTMISGFQPVSQADAVVTARLVSRWRWAGVVTVSALLAYGIAIGFRF